MSEGTDPDQEVVQAEVIVEELREQIELEAAELERARQAEEESRRQGAELKRQLDRLEQINRDLQLRQVELEKSLREAQQRADALKMKHAYAENTISNLNHSLTYCENKAWELMARLRDHLKTPGHLLGHHYTYLSRNWPATLKNALLWPWNHMLGRPFVMAKALGATYDGHDVRGGLEHLSFYARDAKRRIADLPIATPTSMAGHSFQTARQPRPDLIVYSITDWSFRRQRPQHLVTRLLKNGGRAFVMPTDTIGLGVEHPTDRQIMERMVFRSLTDAIWEIQPCSFKPLNIYRDDLRDPRDLALLRRSLTMIRACFCIGQHIGLVQLPFWGPLAAGLPGAKVIYDCMDNHRDFSTNAEGMLEQEDRLLTEADAVIVSSRFLDEMVGDKPRAKHLIRNGCEYDYFSTPPARLDPIVAELEGPVIGYYGAISDWFNAPLVEELARRRPDWRFVLIGHTFGAQIDRLRALPNVIFTGEVAYERLTSFLDRFDVCMIPFLLTDLILATNPVKIYEYSAAGKPTVATRIPEVEQLGDLAAVADDAAGFEAAIQRCLDEPDKEARAARLRAFARQNDWDARVAVLERALRVHAYPRVSVVVLSYHNWPVTNECLQSILHETVYPNFELIVIDNGSDPSTREQLLALENLKDPRLQIRINEENLGYAGGNNQGCRMAEGDYLILLNNDTICPPEWIDKILQPFQEDPKIGLVSPMTNFAGNEQMLDVNCLSNQNQREWLKEFYRLRRGLRHEADRLGFFCVAIRREAYEQIGELDAGFEVGYFEDDDYCKRAVEAGWKLVVAEDAFVYHHGSLSFNRFDKPECEAIKQKNRARFEAKHNCQWQPPISEYMFFDEGGPGYTDRPNVIVGPCADWLSPVDRPQQMALALANEGCRVYYVTDNEEQDRFLGIRLLRPNLYLVENREECIREVCAQPISLLISFSPKADALLARVNAARVMVDLSEETAHTPWKWRRDDPRFLQAAERARWISAWSQSLTSALPAHLQEKVVPIPDGIETERFRQAPPPLPPEDLGKIIADMGGPIVACLGCVEGVCDWDWLEGLARQRRDWPFLFLDTGNKMPDRELPDFFNLRNVFLLPNRPACDLPDYLAHVDVGLIACVDAVADVACNWRSLLRFAAMGIPIVTNRRPDDPALEKTCRLAADPEAAVQAIEQCLPLRQDREFHRQCRQAIQSRDWRELLAPLTKQLMQGL